MGQPAYDSEVSIDAWMLTPEDHVRVAGKSQANRVAFAVLLLFFRANGRFPEGGEIQPSVVALVAQQIGIDIGPIAEHAWQGRTTKRLSVQMAPGDTTVGRTPTPNGKNRTLRPCHRCLEAKATL